MNTSDKSADKGRAGSRPAPKPGRSLAETAAEETGSEDPGSELTEQQPHDAAVKKTPAAPAGGKAKRP